VATARDAEDRAGELLLHTRRPVFSCSSFTQAPRRSARRAFGLHAAAARSPAVRDGPAQVRPIGRRRTDEERGPAIGGWGFVRGYHPRLYHKSCELVALSRSPALGLSPEHLPRFGFEVVLQAGLVRCS
jgi:hypothetical protein